MRVIIMKNIKKISLIIFDMDGLMLDTERISMEALQKASRRYGYKITQNVVFKMIGMNSQGCEAIFRESFGDSFPLNDIRKLKSKFASRIINKTGIPVKAGLYELLEFLKQKPVLIAVATSTAKKSAEKLLESAHILDKFHLIVYGDEVTEGKPDPEIFLKVADKLNCKPEECIVFEDSENGIIAAARAKMIPIMIPDMKEPSNEIEILSHRKFKTLLDAKEYLKEYL
ncbi:HAD family phosphatase [Clostridium sp. CF012]|uniref:HAD family hydrolase n=1 Tax=Clostridium sp. CF012 TaxID=2843319 RepID=UPI001C0CAF3B|nr:HAD family phosphatase [Clostridium sp. CF012]MBU3143263.1 HAD family phosphatase [Clostridium sp. CF012]